MGVLRNNRFKVADRDFIVASRAFCHFNPGRKDTYEQLIMIFIKNAITSREKNENSHSTFRSHPVSQLNFYKIY